MNITGYTSGTVTMDIDLATAVRIGQALQAASCCCFGGTSDQAIPELAHGEGECPQVGVLFDALAAAFEASALAMGYQTGCYNPKIDGDPVVWARTYRDEVPPAPVGGHETPTPATQTGGA